MTVSSTARLKRPRAAVAGATGGGAASPGHRRLSAGCPNAAAMRTSCAAAAAASVGSCLVCVVRPAAPAHLAVSPHQHRAPEAAARMQMKHFPSCKLDNFSPDTDAIDAFCQGQVLPPPPPAAAAVMPTGGNVWPVAIYWIYIDVGTPPKVPAACRTTCHPFLLPRAAACGRSTSSFSAARPPAASAAVPGGHRLRIRHARHPGPWLRQLPVGGSKQGLRPRRLHNRRRLHERRPAKPWSERLRLRFGDVLQQVIRAVAMPKR